MAAAAHCMNVRKILKMGQCCDLIGQENPGLFHFGHGQFQIHAPPVMHIISLFADP